MTCHPHTGGTIGLAHAGVAWRENWTPVLVPTKILAALDWLNREAFQRFLLGSLPMTTNVGEDEHGKRFRRQVMHYISCVI